MIRENGKMGNTNYSSIRRNYTAQLSEFYKGGAFPEKSSADMRFAIDCQKKRIDKLGLTMEKKFEKSGAENEKAWQYVKYPYTYTVISNRCNYEAVFHRNGNFAGRSDISDETLYMGILEKQSQEQDRCTCKNCGHTDFLSKFISGCPMCGTTYESIQSYPCVSGYYTRPTLLSKKAAKGLGMFYFWIFGILGIFFGLVAGLSISSENGYNFVEGLAMTLFTIVLFAGGLLLFAFIVSIFMAGPLLAAKKCSDLSAEEKIKTAAATKTRMEAELKRYIPDFSYELLEEKVISLLRCIVFSADRKTLTVFDGSDDLSYMDDIVDVEYRGAVEYVGHSVVDNILRISVKAYVTCGYYNNGFVTFRKQVFNMILAKRVKEEDLGFTIHAVNCKSCSGSFDAVHVSTCPYCGAQYSLIEDNWVVNQIVLTEQ